MSIDKKINADNIVIERTEKVSSGEVKITVKMPLYLGHKDEEARKIAKEGYEELVKIFTKCVAGLSILESMGSVKGISVMAEYFCQASEEINKLVKENY